MRRSFPRRSRCAVALQRSCIEVREQRLCLSAAEPTLDTWIEWSNIALAAPITANIAQLSMWRLTGDDYVHINEWTIIGSSSANILSTPRGLDVDPQGRTLVAESGASRVSIFDSSGARAGTIELGSGSNSPARRRGRGPQPPHRSVLLRQRKLKRKPLGGRRGSHSGLL